MFSMCQMKSLPLNNLIQYIYPDLYPIYALEEQVIMNLKLNIFLFYLNSCNNV